MSTSSLLLLLLSLCGSCYCWCLPPWVQNEGSCYFYNVQYLSWHEAKEVCNSLGSHLVDIKSPAENNFVTTLLANRPMGFAWIGINDIVTDGTWVYTSGCSVVYTNWRTGEPNNANGHREDCGGIYNTGYWNDDVCDTTRRFPSVCKKSGASPLRGSSSGFRSPLVATATAGSPDSSSPLTSPLLKVLFLPSLALLASDLVSWYK